MVAFMRNYACGGRFTDNLVEIQRIRPSKKDYPRNSSPMEEKTDECQKAFGPGRMRNFYYST
jgi:hypothetical protein